MSPQALHGPPDHVRHTRLAPIAACTGVERRRLASRARSAECLIRRAARESGHFTPKGIPVVRVQIVNGRRTTLLLKRDHLFCAMSSGPFAHFGLVVGPEC